MEIELKTWNDVHGAVSRVNPKLAKLIDHLSPSKKYPLIKVRYGFGDAIVKDGVLQLPGDTECVGITSSELSHLVDKNLFYNALPMGIFIQNAGEVFLETQTRVLPLKVFDPGDLFGVFEALDYVMEKPSMAAWSVSAGSRTVFSLPKISDLNGIKRLRAEFSIPSSLQVKTQQDHWELFKYIAKKQSSWSCEVLFFTKPWLDQLKDPAWSEFFYYLFNVGWTQSKLAIEKILSAHAWQKFSNALAFRNLKPHSYIVDTARHLLLMSNKLSVGMVPATEKDHCLLPLMDIVEVLVNMYKLKKYAPTLMLAKNLNNLKKGEMVYYSLSYPINIDGSVSHASKGTTIFSDLRVLKSLIDTFRNCDKKDVGGFFDHSELFYFHVEDDIYGEIPNSKKIEIMDDRFSIGASCYLGRKFCYSSLFFRGCIMVKFL